MAAPVARPVRARRYNTSAETDAEVSPSRAWVAPTPQAADGRRCRLTAKQMAATSQAVPRKKATFLDLNVMISKLIFGCHKELNCNNRKEKSRFFFCSWFSTYFCALHIFTYILCIYIFTHIYTDTNINTHTYMATQTMF